MYHVWLMSPDGSNQRYHHGYDTVDAALVSAAKILRDLGAVEAEVSNIPDIGIRLRSPRLPVMVVVRNALILEEDGSMMTEAMVSDIREVDNPGSTTN